MKIWFIRHHNESLGPYTPAELKNLAVSKEDYVWKEGLPDWVKAGTRPELEDIFIVAVPPPFATPPANPHHNAPTPFFESSHASGSTFTVPGARTRSRLLWIFLLLFLSIVTYFVYAKNHSASPFGGFKKSPQQIRAELVETEKQNPVQFIDCKTKCRKNLIGQAVIEGTITNIATIAVFKDVELEVSFISKTNAVIASQRFNVYEVIAAGQTKTFKQKFFVPKEVKGARVTIINAAPLN
jgi:hypothetical protein